MKKTLKKERINYSRKQLYEFLKLPSAQERFEAYRKLLKSAISRLYDVIMEDTSLEYEEIEHLKRDYLHLDVECIPFCIDKEGTISFTRYVDAKELKYPEGDYTIINEKCGLYKYHSEEKARFSERIAIDYALVAFANVWYNRIPEILELFDIHS